MDVAALVVQILSLGFRIAAQHDVDVEQAIAKAKADARAELDRHTDEIAAKIERKHHGDPQP